jgi:hypothetical protein
MYTTYHFQSAADINADVIDAIKAAFKDKSVVLTVEEETDETAFLLAHPQNKAMLMQSIAEDKNQNHITASIPTNE